MSEKINSSTNVTRTHTGPVKGFILVCDCEGDPQEIFSKNCNLDEVFYFIDMLDRNDPDYAPHSAWEYNSGGFSRVFEQIITK